MIKLSQLINLMEVNFNFNNIKGIFLFTGVSKAYRVSFFYGIKVVTEKNGLFHFCSAVKCVSECPLIRISDIASRLNALCDSADFYI